MQDVVICFRILAFITNFNEIGREQIRAAGNDLFEDVLAVFSIYLPEGENYCSNRKIIHKAALIRMIKVLSGDGNIEDVEGWMNEQGIREEDEVTVCELFDQYERKGKAEGEARRLVMDIENAMKFFQVTLEKACEGLGTTVSGYEEAKKLI